MALPGIPIPETQCIGDSLFSINNALTSLDVAAAAAAAAAASSGVTKITAGANVTISPAGGTGDVTINAPAPFSLPERLGENSKLITNWNDATTNGWYMGNESATNAPDTSQWYMGYVQAHNNAWTTQIVHGFSSDNKVWKREQNGTSGVWTNWVEYADITQTEFTVIKTRLDSASSVIGIVQCDGNGDFSAAAAAKALSVVDSPTIDLSYDSTTGVLSAVTTFVAITSSSPMVAKAWVIFNGRFASAPFTVVNGGIIAAHNITSVTDDGIGQYKLNFAPGLMTSTNYMVLGYPEDVQQNYQPGVIYEGPSNLRTLTEYQVYILENYNNVLWDSARVQLVVYGGN